tara:strand:+ start:1243 stop:2142 length:900 start_codon:yes stop_codon:yes gene_type:complete
MEFYITQKDWKKVIDYAQASYDEFKSEIGGFLIATKDKDGDIILSTPEILEQEVTGGTTEMEKAAIADYYVKSAMKYGKDVRFVWWHSHANMSAFWSGTDTNTMKEYKNDDWSAFLVVNIRGEYKFRVCIWNPITAHEDIELHILDSKPKTVPKSIKDSVSKLCNKPVTVMTNYMKNGKQTSIYDKDEWDRDSYIHNYYGNNYKSHFDRKQGFSGDKMYDSSLEILGEWNDLYTEGQFTFKEWLKEVKNWNKILKLKQSTFSIKEYTENELQVNSGFYGGYNPTSFIDYGEGNEQNIKV